MFLGNLKEMIEMEPGRLESIFFFICDVILGYILIYRFFPQAFVDIDFSKLTILAIGSVLPIFAIYYVIIRGVKEFFSMGKVYKLITSSLEEQKAVNQGKDKSELNNLTRRLNSLNKGLREHQWACLGRSATCTFFAFLLTLSYAFLYNLNSIYSFYVAITPVMFVVLILYFAHLYVRISRSNKLFDLVKETPQKKEKKV